MRVSNMIASKLDSIFMTRELLINFRIVFRMMNSLSLSLHVYKVLVLAERVGVGAFVCVCVFIQFRELLIKSKSIYHMS